MKAVFVALLLVLALVKNTFLKPNIIFRCQRTRICLAKALLREPDFLFLDEPTNHLDIEMIEWLEGF